VNLRPVASAAPAATQSSAEAPATESGEDELLTLFPYGLVALPYGDTTVLFPLPSSLAEPGSCLSREQRGARYDSPLALDAFDRDHCAGDVAVLRALRGRPIQLFDEFGRSQATAIAGVTIKPQLSAFQLHALAAGEITVEEAYRQSPIVEVTLEASVDRKRSWAFARLSPLPAPEFLAPVTKPNTEQATFIEAQLSEFGRQLVASSVPRAEAEANSAAYATNSGLVFFADLEEGDVPCGDDDVAYAQVTLSTYQRQDAAEPIGFADGPTLKQLPELVWYDSKRNETLLLFRERYSHRPQIYSYDHGKLVPVLVLPTVHPDNHPC
jgi:hypothetical protein